MPSAITPQRRRREDDESDDESYRSLTGPNTASSRQSRSNKKARRDINGSVPSPQEQLLPNGYLSQPHASTQAEPLAGGSVQIEYQPGSIVRVKLANFVTYTAVEFYPGPSLNMVIGPNGTGKSTLVCAICLGLGWGPQHLGRAKDISEYVKYGAQDATIEIELARDPKHHRRNPVIRCNIKREGNKSHFFINDKPSNKKAVMELARSFSIQIDNLCQFLPQDKVVEFAAMTPIELLRSTQRAVAPQEMIDIHEELKTLRGNQRSIQVQNASDLETLANLESRQRMQEADVERMRERDGVKERIRMLEAARPFAQYRASKNKSQEAKDRRKAAMRELKAMKEEVEPSLQAVNSKQQYQDQIKRVVDERKRSIDKADRKAENCSAKVEKLQEQIQDLENEKEAEKKGNKANKGETIRLEQIVTRLKKQMEEPPIELDVSAFNERIREKQRASQDLIRQASELQSSMSDMERDGRDRNARINQAQRDLENLESQAGQQNKKLFQTSRDSAAAWQWIQEHQDEFEKHVYGPPIVECSIKDPRYVDLIESIVSKNDFLCFTVQTRSDFQKLHDQVHQRMRLKQVNIRTMSGGLDKFGPPVNEEQARRYGFDGWALDYLIGPEPVLAMLCAEGPRLNQSGISLRDTTPEQYDMLQDSPVSSWVTSKSLYRINRRREYGPGATSTQVRALKKAEIWTSQPVDLTAKRELQENIDGWMDEVRTIEARIDRTRAQVLQLKGEKEEIDREQKTLADNKAARQKAIGEFKALPTRLAQQEEKLAAVRKVTDGVRDRFQALEEKQDVLTLEKGEAALDYRKAVDDLRIANNELQEAEVMLIEATSDVEVLVERNSAVKQQLETKQREVDAISKAFEVIVTEVRKLLAACEKLFDPSNEDETLKEFMRTLPREQTPEELEAEIESEYARLELMHEGNDDVIREFELRQKKIDGLKSRLQDVQNALEELDGKIKEAREQWEPKLDKLVRRISDSFGYNMKQINCAGEVGVYKDEQDFDQWAIQIQVKFRENEPLTQLDSHRQSGGERAVSTIFYLMSLQSLTRSPFRVVDEINQGMDPRNERLVHARMVSIATGNDDQQFQLDDDEDDVDGQSSNNKNSNGKSSRGSQYFLITPKLLHGLKYERGMRVLCIASGEFMPQDQTSINFRACVDIRRGIKAVG